MAERRWDNTGSRAALAVAAVILLIAAFVILGRLGPGWPFFPHRSQQVATAGCPRPDAGAQAPGFGDQQRQVRRLRQQGFRGDFFAQLDLGRRYEARRDVDRNLQDPVEAAVWYALALTNPNGYAPVVERQAMPGRRGELAPSLFEDCRAFERNDASQTLDRLWSQMSSDEQEEVRRRVIYVLYTQGPPGFRILARATSSGAGAYGEPAENAPSNANIGDAPLPVELFPPNDVDSYLYSYLAAQSGDIGGYVLLKDFEQGAGTSYADFVQTKANRWVPPFEFYPPDAAASGAPHSDESRLDGEADEAAMARLADLPFLHVGQALAFLQVIPRPVVSERELRPEDARTLQAMLGRPPTGRLSALEKVRAIQYAAVNGSSHAQLLLAVMYSEGVGVRTDYARAFYWYQRAARQGSGEAKFAIANYFSLGVDGVADQDKAKAVVYRLDSAMAGFKPSAERIQAVLAQVSRKPHS